jgi:hypothetical protein
VALASEAQGLLEKSTSDRKAELARWLATHKL